MATLVFVGNVEVAEMVVEVALVDLIEVICKKS